MKQTSWPEGLAQSGLLDLLSWQPLLAILFNLLEKIDILRIVTRHIDFFVFLRIP